MNTTPEKVHDKSRFPFHPGSFIDIFYCNVLQNTEKRFENSSLFDILNRSSPLHTVTKKKFEFVEAQRADRMLCNRKE